MRPDDNTQVTFSCSGRQGALLYLPFPAEREDTVALGDFGKWMVNNIYNCMRLAEERGMGVNHMEDIILVACVIWRGRGSEPFSLKAGVVQRSRCSPRVRGFRRRNVSGAQLEFGPNGEVGFA